MSKIYFSILIMLILAIPYSALLILVNTLAATKRIVRPTQRKEERAFAI